MVVKENLLPTGMTGSFSEPSFGERFAYARWLYHGIVGHEPSQAAIGKRVGRAQPSVAEWYDRTDPPAHWEVHGPLADYLKVPQPWLIHGSGEPPEPVLWKWWIEQSRRRPKRASGQPISRTTPASGAGTPKRRRTGTGN